MILTRIVHKILWVNNIVPLCMQLLDILTDAWRISLGQWYSARRGNWCPVYARAGSPSRSAEHLQNHGPLARYVKLWFAHAPGMPGTVSRPRFQRKPLVSDPDMQHGTCVTRVSWCMSGSLTRSGGEIVLGFPGACATRIFTYLVRGPLHVKK